MAGIAAAAVLGAVFEAKKATAQPKPPSGGQPPTCTSVTQKITARTFTDAPVSAPVFGTNQYFIETDTFEDICNDTGQVIESGTFDIAVTPAMVARNPSDYPQYIVDTYRQMYPEAFA